MSKSAPIAAANRVLRAAEAWRDDLIPKTATTTWTAARDLAYAVDDYRRAVAAEHVQGPDIDADG